MMKRSKLEWYQLYLLTTLSWHLVIRYDGDETEIKKALDHAYTAIKKSIMGIPRRGCPTLYTMKRVVEDSNWVNEIASK